MTRPYAGTARGAEWHRWDLHIHSPASYQQHFGDGKSPETWDRYIEALSKLPSDIRAIGVNDYFSIDGYRRVLEARDAGRLPNLELILPVVELRLTAFVGSGETRKLNFHVVFADTISVDTIEQFFLRQLNVELKLDGGQPWRGCLGTEPGLIDLGKAVMRATPDDRRTNVSDLQAGFGNAAIDLPVVLAAIEQSIFKDQVLTALGVGEWSQMRWQGAGAAQKRNAIERADFILTAAPSLSDYESRRKQLAEAQVNTRLIDASDAHYFANSTEPNRLGRGQSWIKADLSFQGLQRALTRFDDRVFVGAMPPKLERVRLNRTKYIERLTIRKKEASPLKEAWFDTEIPFNHDLVAIIGNQGSGKSALTDILALCGQTHVDGFSFLTTDKFRDKQKRASHFIGTITWEDAQQREIPLDRAIDRSTLERVRYIPQGFFDDVTNEKAVLEEGKFYGEIKKTIFSHVPLDERLQCASLDELVLRHTHAANEELARLRSELAEINQTCQMIESQCSALEIQRLDAAILDVERQIAALEAQPPLEITPPSESAEASRAIEALLSEAAALRGQIDQANQTRGNLRRQRTALDQAIQSLQGDERRLRTAIEKTSRVLKSEGLEIDVASVLTLRADYAPMESVRDRIDSEVQALEDSVNIELSGSLASRLEGIEMRRTRLQAESESAANAYQAYLVSVAEWKGEIAAQRGEGTTPTSESLAGLRLRRQDLTVAKPGLLHEAIAARREKTREIYRVLERLAQVHETIARPVRDHIETNKLTREHYRLAFDVKMAESGLADRLFSIVGQASGSFSGVQPGQMMLRRLVAEADFTSEDGALAFADNLFDCLVRDHRCDPPEPVSLAGLLKKGATVSDVYDLVYSLEYLKPSFELGLNGKPLRQLSPGERGIMLLVFYLVVDLSDEPLIIDQPEGNLNNQSIVDHLVPVIIAAKNRRQIIIVTHNPNIAVVCDAEQIIHCEMKQDGSHSIRYSTGSLENPKFNQLSLDLLEGTRAALDARVVTYHRPTARTGVVELPVMDWIV